jgi:hypothetical protein
MITCYRCAKLIKGKMITNNPSILLIELGLDFQRSYHPDCYAQENKEAEKELKLATSNPAA